MLVYHSLLKYSKYVDRHNNHHCHEKPLLHNAHERKKHQKTPPTKTLKWYNLTLRSKVPASTCRNLPHKLSERLISLGALRLPDCFGTSNFHRPRKFMLKQIKRPKKQTARESHGTRQKKNTCLTCIMIPLFSRKMCDERHEHFTKDFDVSLQGVQVGFRWRVSQRFMTDRFWIDLTHKKMQFWSLRRCWFD